MKNKEKTVFPSLEQSLEKVIAQEKKYNDYEYPRISVIVPIYNCAEKISMTLDSILDQIYPDFEVIFVDAGSTDRSLEVIQNYRDDRIHLYSVSSYQRYEMLNRGISQATGEYINCLFPGDFYIYQHTLHHMMEIALDNHEPDLIFCGTFLRDGKTDPKILLRSFSINLLKKGQQPTSLQSCWFRTESIRELGKFDSSYNLRGGYELMCRFSQNSKFRNVFTKRVLTDYDLRLVTRTMVFQHFKETYRTIWNYFGIFYSIQWLFIQRDSSRLIRIWLRSIKMAFLGR
jgi:glycosyltransferase involved in cell wall biosynthesis